MPVLDWLLPKCFPKSSFLIVSETQPVYLCLLIQGRVTKKKKKSPLPPFSSFLLFSCFLQQDYEKTLWLPLATYCVCPGILECKLPGPEEKKKKEVLYLLQPNIYFNGSQTCSGIRIFPKPCFNNRLLALFILFVEFSSTLPASWEICMQVKKQQ